MTRFPHPCKQCGWMNPQKKLLYSDSQLSWWSEYLNIGYVWLDEGVTWPRIFCLVFHLTCWAEWSRRGHQQNAFWMIQQELAKTQSVYDQSKPGHTWVESLMGRLNEPSWSIGFSSDYRCLLRVETAYPTPVSTACVDGGIMQHSFLQPMVVYDLPKCCYPRTESL